MRLGIKSPKTVQIVEKELFADNVIVIIDESQGGPEGPVEIEINREEFPYLLDALTYFIKPMMI